MIGITSTDPGVVRSNDVLRRAVETAQREEDEKEDNLTEDPFADIELEAKLTCLHVLTFTHFLMMHP